MFPSYFTVVQKSDAIFLGFVLVCAVLLIGITGTMVAFVLRYSRKRHPVAAPTGNHPVLEIVWTLVPTILVLGMFYYGWIGFKEMRGAPADAIPVKVTGRMWSWLFEYENGRTSDVLFVPVKKPVQLLMNSQDVLHSFFIPAFRIKEDLVPGMETHLWFQAEREGSYDVFCAEYCGEGHSRMLTSVEAVSPEAFHEWYEEAADAGGLPAGAALLQSKGCTGCHSVDGSRIVGPTFQGIGGRRSVVMTGGTERTIPVDREYLRRSLLEPAADVVKGYPPIMPPQGGTLTQDDIHEIVEYLMTLK